MTDAVTRMRHLAQQRVPFVHQGRCPAGMDCVGALVYALQYAGNVPDYPEDPVNGQLELALTAALGAPAVAKACTADPPLALGLLRAGDIVSMQYAGPERHVGMLANHPNIPGVLTLIHTDAMLGRVTEHTLDTKWQRRVVKVWRP